jgi:hypothetical protein
MQLIIVIIITYFGSLISIYLGYKIGSKQEINIKLPRIFKKKHSLGAIPKLSPKELELKGTKRGDAEKAMEETLDKIL